MPTKNTTKRTAVKKTAENTNQILVNQSIETPEVVNSTSGVSDISDIIPNINTSVETYSNVSDVSNSDVSSSSASSASINSVGSSNDTTLASILASLQGLQTTIEGLNQKVETLEKANSELETKNKNLQAEIQNSKKTFSTGVNVSTQDSWDTNVTMGDSWPSDDNIRPINNSVSQVVNQVSSQRVSSTDVQTDMLLKYLANKKSDREITIVHNRELIGGLTTHIELTGLVIDFRTLGEQRVLSWQQFEECVSKYRSWFNKEIILLGAEHKELAESYNIPTVKRNSGVSLSRNDLAKVGLMGPRELEDFYNSLTKEDQGFLCSFWLGKCYEKDPNFYNRYKIDVLSRLADNGAFDNIIAIMNNDYDRGGNKSKNNSDNVQQGQNRANSNMIGSVK